MYEPRSNLSVRNVNMLERWFSMIGGGALTTLGLRHGGFRGMLLTLVGGYFVQRGLTGHCAIYETIGINTAANLPESYSGYNPTASARYNQDSDNTPSQTQTVYEQQADQAEGERSPSQGKSTRVGTTPGSAEGDRETVEVDLQAKQNPAGL